MRGALQHPSAMLPGPLAGKVSWFPVWGLPRAEGGLKDVGPEHSSQACPPSQKRQLNLSRSQWFI